MKRTVRLKESELKHMIGESVQKVINEMDANSDDLDEQERIAKEISQSIETGEYDDKLDDILQNKSWKVFNFGAQFPFYEIIDDAAYERKCLIDKEYALSHGKDADYTERNSVFHPNYTEIGMKYKVNPNKYDSHNTDYLMWRHNQNMKERMKNQRIKDKRWQKSADSRPLHRKGSLNRAMDESINRKINRIVSESIRRNIR